MADSFDQELEEIMALLNGTGEDPEPPAKPETAQRAASASPRPEEPRQRTQKSAEVEAEPQPRTRRSAEQAKQNRSVGHAPVSQKTVPAKPEASQQEQSQIASPLYGIPFIILLMALMVFSFMIPLRPTVSERERRNLNTFPEFSVKALASGDYFSGIDDWFSDTFPGRETWLDMSDSISNLKGINTVSIDYASTPTEGDEIPDVAEATAVSGQTADVTVEFSEEEISVEDTEEVMPIEEDELEELQEIESDEALVEWGGLDNSAAAEITFGNVIQIDDSCYNYFTFNQENSDRHVAIANAIGDILADKEVRFFDMLVPGSLNVMLSSDFAEELGSSNPAEALNYIYAGENDNVIPVNVFNTLVSHNDEYIYFRTDHHWTDLGAYYAYTVWCEAAGFEPVTLDSYTELDMGAYRGSFYSKAPNSSKLLDDTLIAYLPPGDLTTVIDTGDGKYVADAVRDLSNAKITYKYQAFICGDNQLTVITNNDLPDAPNCLIVQDSFGNPFCVFLAQHYHKVYIVDYREGFITFSRFTSTYNISDVILEESLSTIQGSDTNYLINRMAK